MKNPGVVQIDKSVLYRGDCSNVLKTLPNNFVHAMIVDPPYGLSEHSQQDIETCLNAWLSGGKYRHKKAGFMQAQWDSFVPGPEIWRECLRIMRPGAHAVVFAGARTADLMGISLRLAGFEMRDCLYWACGSRMPKSFNFGDGLGSQLKPAIEPAWLVRKPLDGTIEGNVAKWGCGALNIDQCRIGTEGGTKAVNFVKKADGRLERWDEGYQGARNEIERLEGKGRWPAHLILEDSEEISALFPQTSTSIGLKQKAGDKKFSGHIYREYTSKNDVMGGYDDSGSAARYFQACPDDDPEDERARRLIYCPKASRKDREEGCEDMPERFESCYGDGLGDAPSVDGIRKVPIKNHHISVKPTALLTYLCKLVIPKNGIVIDPFMGSGSTGKAAHLTGYRFIGIEREADYFDIAVARAKYGHERQAADV